MAFSSQEKEIKGCKRENTISRDVLACVAFHLYGSNSHFHYFFAWDSGSTIQFLILQLQSQDKSGEPKHLSSLLHNPSC